MYDDLKEAIAATTLVWSSPDLAIIGGDERSRMDWIMDFRALLLQPYWLNRYAEIFWELNGSEYPFQVCGMETAAISMVAAIVMKGTERGTPVNGVYIRKSRKRQGLLKQIEGTLNNEKVILVDDLINSGSTFNKQIKILAAANARVAKIYALIGFKEKSAYSFLEVPVQTPFTLPDFGIPLQKASSTEPQKDPFEIVWHFVPPQRPQRNIVHAKSGPVIDEKRVFFGTDSGVFFALDQNNGHIVWRFDNAYGDAGAFFSTPLLHEKTVYVGSQNGTLYAFDAKSGSVRWTYEEADSIGSSPTVAPRLHLVYAGLGFGLQGQRGALVAFETGTGKVRWRARLPNKVRSSPLYIPEENMVIIGDDGGNVCGYSADDGRPLFHTVVSGRVFGGFAYDAKRRAVYCMTTNGVCCGIFVLSGDIVYTKEALAMFSTPLIKDDTLYFSSLDKRIYAIDLGTGKEKWRYATLGRVFASPTFFNESLWCGSNDGILYELDPASGKLRSSFQFSERIVNTPVFNKKTGRLFVPTQANEIYCLKRRPPSNSQMDT